MSFAIAVAARWRGEDIDRPLVLLLLRAGLRIEFDDPECRPRPLSQPPPPIRFVLLLLSTPFENKLLVEPSTLGWLGDGTMLNQFFYYCQISIAQPCFLDDLIIVAPDIQSMQLHSFVL